MPAEKNGNGNGHMPGNVCVGCGSCGCTGRGRSWTFFLLRTLITIIILMVVFWFGVVAGRLGGGGYARYGMMRTGYAYPADSVTGTAGAPMIPASSTQGGY